MARTTGCGRLLFWAAVIGISVLALLMIRRWSSYRQHTLSTRVRALCAFEASALGRVLIALRAILCMIYYEHPDAAREVGIELEPLVPRHG